jgi:hypothetical protein
MVRLMRKSRAHGVRFAVKKAFEYLVRLTALKLKMMC